MASQWSVVRFDDGSQLVPINWIQGNMCYWPTFTSNSRYEKAVKNGETPNINWPQYHMRVLGTYSSYEVGRRKLVLADEQSDLNTDVEYSKERRRARKKKRIEPICEEAESDCSDEDEYTISEFPQARKNARNQIRACNSGKNIRSNNSQDETTLLEGQVDQIDVIPRASSSRSASQTLLLTPTSALGSGSSRCSTPQITANCDEDFKSKLFKELSFIKIHLIKVGQRLSALEANINSPQTQVIDDADNEFEELVKNQFPLQLQTDLQNIETLLMENSNFKKYLISYCSRFGGHKVDEVTKTILKRLLSNKLAADYSWLGAKKKISLCGLQIAEVVELKFEWLYFFICTLYSEVGILLAFLIVSAAVNRNKSLTNVTEKEIVDAIKNWLRHASARYSNQRNKKNMNNAAAQNESQTE